MTIESYDLAGFKPRGYPVRHKRKVPFRPRINVPSGFPQRARRIKELDLDLDGFILTAKDYTDLVVDAYASNVHWSTKIEGNPLTEAEVRKITRDTFRGRKGEKRSGPRQEVVNHLVHLTSPESYRLPWGHEMVLRLHSYLLEATGTAVQLGAYRQTHAVVRTDSGQEVFIPAPHQAIREEMSALLDWINGEGQAFEPIVAATVLFHEFEGIHPFEDGNGRVGRSLFHLYLQNNGLPNSHLCKIECELLSRQELYYQLLAYADESGSYSELLDLVSGAVLRSYESTQRMLAKKDLLSSNLDETSKTILKRARRTGDWFSVEDVGGWVESVSAQTVRNKMNALVGLGALEKRGHTRSCRYRMRDPMVSIRDLFASR